MSTLDFELIRYLLKIWRWKNFNTILLSSIPFYSVFRFKPFEQLNLSVFC